MNDDIFRPGGGDGWEHGDPPWSPADGPVDATPFDGFAVDGTDAFAIEERPVDGPAGPPTAGDGEGTGAGRSRVAVYSASAIVGLLIVIIVGGSTGPRPVVGGEAGEFRSEPTAETSSTTTTDPVDVVVDATGVFLAVPDDWLDDAAPDRYGSPSTYDDESAQFDDELAGGPDDSAVEDLSVDEFDDEFTFDETDGDFSFDATDDGGVYDLPSGSSRSNVVPRRLPVITAPRPRVTLPRPTSPTTAATTTSTTTTTVADTTTSTSTTSTTTSTSTTSTSSTSTTSTTLASPADPQWTADMTGLPAPCVGPLGVWSATDGLVASVSGAGLFEHPATGPWTGPVATTVGTGAQRVFVQDPASGSTFWIGGPDGVFKTVDGGDSFVELGQLTDVRSLTVSGPTLLAVSGATSLWRSDDGGTTWSDLTADAPAGVTSISAAYLLDAGTAMLATEDGVYRTTTGGWTLVSPAQVVGIPVRPTDGSVTWLQAGGAGVLRSTDAGATWTSTASTGVIDPTAVSLVLSPDGGLTTVGARTLVRSVDGGTTWTPFGAPLPFVPAGIARTAADDASVIWSAQCGPNAVQRLDDA